MSEKTTGPDTRQLHQEKLPQGTFPGDQPQDFRIHFTPEVHAEIWKHATEDTSVEVCGVLVGQWKKDERGPFVSITVSIRGEAAASKHAEVTFTHETWGKINAQMDSQYRDLAIVGWYHTHPDFGIFLSERDRFIHDHFFSGPGQIACVIDPIRKLEGMFRWAEGKPRLCPFYWVGAEIHRGESEEGADRRAEPSFRDAGREPQTPAAPAPPVEKVSISSWIMRVSLIVCVFLLGYLLAAKQTADVTRALANFALLKSSRIGLRESLSKVTAELRAEEAVLAKLAESHQRLIQSTPEEAEIRRSWGEFRVRHSTARQALQFINDQYGLSEEETLAISRLLDAQVAAQQDRSPAPAALPSPVPMSPPPPPAEGPPSPRDADAGP